MGQIVERCVLRCQGEEIGFCSTQRQRRALLSTMRERGEHAAVSRLQLCPALLPSMSAWGYSAVMLRGNPRNDPGNNVASDEMQADDPAASHIQVLTPLLALFKVILVAGREGRTQPILGRWKNPLVSVLARCECRECR